MAGSSPETEVTAEDVRALCTLLAEHKAGDVAALDMRPLHSWTDFFVIATCTSGTHRDGLVRRISEFACERGFSVKGGGKASGDFRENGWTLVDMGQAVVHLMSAEARAFYELERLWAQPGAPDRAFFVKSP
jgi:ribosome-associated protein